MCKRTLLLSVRGYNNDNDTERHEKQRFMPPTQRRWRRSLGFREVAEFRGGRQAFARV